MTSTMNATTKKKRGRKPAVVPPAKTLRDQVKEDLMAQGYYIECKMEEENQVRSWLEIRRPGIAAVPAFNGAEINVMMITMVFNYEGTRILSMEVNQETFEVTNHEHRKVFC